MNKFSIEVGSLPDRESLVSEIYYEDLQFAEISQETSDLIIQLYGYPNKPTWKFSLNEFQEIIEKAKQKLIGD